MRSAKRALRGFLALAVFVTGVLHFVVPGPFVRIVPAWLPAPLLLVQISGVAELAGGVGLLVPRLRVAAAWGLILLFIAVFPANLNQALHQIPMNGHAVSPIFLWARLPLQAVLIWAAWWQTRPDPVEASA